MARLYRPLRTLSDFGHSPEDFDVHKEQKAAGESRDAERWLLLPSSPGLSTESAETFGLVGHNFILRDGIPVQVSSQEYVDFLATEKKKRSSYVGPKRRGQKITQTRIKCGTPLVEITPTPAPWVGDFFYIGAQTAPDRVEAALVELSMRLVPVIERLTGCRVLSFSLHFDTGARRAHPNFALTKVTGDENGVMRLIKKDGLRLAGPWAVGVDRQQRSGIVYGPNDAKLRRALDKFRERHPDWGLPTDIQICRCFDEIAEELFGCLKGLRDAYRDRIERERSGALEKRKTVLLAELQALEKMVSISEENKVKKEKYYGKT
jgi:hypothetical protein